MHGETSVIIIIIIFFFGGGGGGGEMLTPYMSDVFKVLPLSY